jgi:hypothetical protein
VPTKDGIDTVCVRSNVSAARDTPCMHAHARYKSEACYVSSDNPRAARKSAKISRATCT